MQLARPTIRVFLSYQGDEPSRVSITAEGEGHASGNLDFSGWIVENNTSEVLVLTSAHYDHNASLCLNLEEENPQSPWPIFNELTLLKKRLWGELRHTRYALSALSLRRRTVREQYKDEHWLRLMADLLRQAQSWKIRFDFHRLRDILRLAEADPRIAYDQLAALFQHDLARRKARIQRRLRAISAAQALFCGLSSTSYSIRNLISSQRSWFLRHGAHPSRSLPLAAPGCFSRVCFRLT